MASLACGLLALVAGCGGSDAPATARATTPKVRVPAPPRSSALAPSLALQAAAVAHYAKAGRPVFCGGRDRRMVALTFDDGPGPYTEIVLRELRDAGAHATFFMVGDSIAKDPNGARLARAEGVHALGDHTQSHANLTALPFAAAREEITAGRKAALAAVHGPISLFRPPYGAHDKRIDAEISRQHMAQILWDVDSEDSDSGIPKNYHQVAAIVRRNIRPGSIVLMHENRGQTVRALRSILPMLRKRHLHAVTVPELLAANPPSRGQYEGGARACGVHADPVEG